MCGIAGLVAGPASAADRAAIVHAMCNQIVHRGPDDEGVYGDENAAIGMRRLSIIDLAGGHQPIHNESRTKWLVFNGEIYNYRELRRELEQAGHRFYTSSDSEVIMHAFEEHDVGCFERLRGMFAIAIWDSVDRRLVLARDRFGKKPLFYAQMSGGSLAFGSELKCLLAVPGWNGAVAREAVREYLLMGYVATPRSIFAGVEKLPAAHWFEWRAGRIRIERYWQLVFGPKLGRSPAQLADELYDRLDEAVRIRLVSDVPFGAFLSGGLDSSVVTALMARHMSTPVRTFTIGFREDEFDERSDARLVARHIGASHEEMVVEPDAVDLVQKLAWHLDEPFGDASAIPTYLVSALAARHVKMVLSGDGGDEMFGGYTRYERYIRLNRLRAASLGLAGPLLGGVGGLLPGRVGRRLRWVGHRLRLPYPADYISGVALNTPALAACLLGDDPDASAGYGAVERHFPAERDGAALDRIVAGDVATYLLDDILVKVDRMSMACSIETRAPLLDHELAQFAVTLPVEQRLRRGIGKHLLRAVGARLLPPRTLVKRKQGFGVPLAAWLRGPLRPMFQDLLASQRFIEHGMFDRTVVRALLDAHVAQVADHSEPLWLVLCFELWARRYLAPAGPDFRMAA